MVCTQPIRVLHVFSCMNRGGAETMIMNLYRNIDRKNVQFDFVVHTNEECAFDHEIESLGGIIYHAPRISVLHIVAYLKWWLEFFNTAPQYVAVHGHLRSIAVFYLSIAKYKKITTIIHSHSTSSGSGMAAIIKTILQFPLRYLADYLFACSLTAGQWLFGKKACNKTTFHILKNAIQAENFTYSKDKRILMRKSLGVENSEIVFGHVGRFIEAKNHIFLLKIFKEILKDIPNSKLLLIGDGGLRDKIVQTVLALNLTEHVIMLGTRADISDLLQAMDIFIFPSIWEGFPVTLIEAQAAGLKCFVSDSITTEVTVTSLVHLLPKNSSASYWKKKILENISYERTNTSAIIKVSGFDISGTSKWLENFYISLKMVKGETHG